MQIRKKFADLFAADLRSLAALRIGVSLIILIDLLQRSSDLVAHYTDYGVAPRWLVIEHMSSRWFASFHFMSGVWQVQAVLFCIAGFIAVMLLMGYKTRLATVASLAFLISLNVRNPYVFQGGDGLLRVVLFWGMFLPWGAKYSIDHAWSSANNGGVKTVYSCGTVAYAVQIICVYWVTAFLKSSPQWWGEGSAVYYALSLDYMVTPIGHVFLQLPSTALRIMTWVVLLIEFFGPILLFCPWRTESARTITVLCFVVLHLGFLLTLFVGLFPLVGIVSMLFFLPPSFWDKFIAWVREPRSALVQGIAVRFCGLARLRDYAVFQMSRDDLKTTKVTVRLSSGASVAALALIAYCVTLAVSNIPNFPLRLSERFRSVGHMLGLDQNWNMFAPFPAKDDGWYVIPGKLKDGRNIDLWQGGKELDWRKPNHVALTYKNHRWRKFMELLRNRDYLREAFAGYLCRDWEKRHSVRDALQEFEIIYMVEWTRPNFAVFAPVKVSIGKFQCQNRA